MLTICQGQFVGIPTTKLSCLGCQKSCAWRYELVKFNNLKNSLSFVPTKYNGNTKGAIIIKKYENLKSIYIKQIY